MVKKSIKGACSLEALHNDMFKITIVEIKFPRENKYKNVFFCENKMKSIRKKYENLGPQKSRYEKTM